MKTFSKTFIRENMSCYSSKELSDCSFMKGGEEITLLAIVQSEIPLKDKFWFVCRKVATKEENKQLAIQCAELVLPIYEKYHPDNKAPREAIEVAKLYITGHITIQELITKRKAAYAAADAAVADAADGDVTGAAYAAAYVIAAAYAAAYAYVTDAADAAYAAYVTYAAAASDYKNDQLLDVLLNYC